LKYLKIGKNEFYAAALIVFATGLRMLLVALGWPATNSDEGTMGIMALHIAYHGEHPLFFYGQDYMGALEAYLAAIFIHLSGGPSLFALRLGVILLVMFFFISTYLLSSLLFSKELGLVTLALLSVGSIPYLTRQMIATGGSSQTLLFGSLAFLLATWLALTYRRGATLRIKFWRLLGYFCWGLVVGLGMWSDMVVLPFLAVSALLLLVFCWRNLFWGWLGIGAGIFTGMFPSLRYSALHQLNPLAVVLGLFQGTGSQAPRTLAGMLHGIHETLFVSIPTATGNPFCPVQELYFLSDNTPRTPVCEAVRSVWGTGYVVLLGLALLLAIIALWRLRARLRTETELSAGEKQQLVVRHSARLLMLGAGALAITAYAISSAPVSWPGFHARYLIGLLIITPAVIEPLWSAASQWRSTVALKRVRALAGWGLLVLIGGILLTGTLIGFREVPAAQVVGQQRVDLINNLLRIGATRIYTDYWSCNNIAFASNERIICGVMNGELQPSHNRDPHYFSIVSNDPHAAYVYPRAGQMPAVEHKVQQSHGHYRRYDFAGYIIYQPVSTG
jgi:hypothetical protein